MATHYRKCLAGLGVLMLALAMGCSENNHSSDEKAAVERSAFDRADSVLTVKVTSDSVILKDDTLKDIKAWPADEDGMVPVVGDDFVYAGKQLLFTLNEKLALNSELFYSMTVCDVTKLTFAEGEVIRVGRLQELHRTDYDPKALLTFLVKTGILRTFAHVEGETKLVRVTSVGENEDLHLMTRHVYFTNEENIETISYRLRINRSPLGGEMFLLPAEHDK